MGNIRKQHSGKFKSQVAVVAIRDDHTMSELSSEYRVNASAITRWKKQALEALPEALGKRSNSGDKSQDELVPRLCQEIG